MRVAAAAHDVKKAKHSVYTKQLEQMRDQRRARHCAALGAEAVCVDSIR